jgi:hypothetical protein
MLAKLQSVTHAGLGTARVTPYGATSATQHQRAGGGVHTHVGLRGAAGEEGRKDAHEIELKTTTTTTTTKQATYPYS